MPTIIRQHGVMSMHCLCTFLTMSHKHLQPIMRTAR
jgi:hypothetical protein